MQCVKNKKFLIGLVLVAACGGDKVTTAPNSTITSTAACPAIDVGLRPPPAKALSASVMNVAGLGRDSARYTAEVAATGNVAYTTTWGSRGINLGNKVDIWDVSGAAPVLVDSLIVQGASTLGDVQVSDDASLLVVATERVGGSIVIFDIKDPRHPRLLTRYSSANTNPGVHTAKLGRVNGRLYGFLSIDPLNATPARLVIVDLSDPTSPQEVFTKVIGNPYVHDTFVRDGLLFLALWDDGVEIWDIGGCGRDASPSNPIVLGNVKTLGGEVHNIWWYHDPQGGKRFAFVGQEGPGTVGATSNGDIHVIDVSDFAAPKEVAFYHVDGAGTHNFSVDEKNGVLYAAYYNGGVRALDIHGDLTSCPGADNFTNGITRCDLKAMGRELAVALTNQNRDVYVWGVAYTGNAVYASDMVNGIWKLNPAK